jgi:hypothetical protein
MNMSFIPFETELEDILFTIKMALLSCRISPKPERQDYIRQEQAERILEDLERSGYRIVKIDKDRGVKPSNIGG